MTLQDAQKFLVRVLHWPYVPARVFMYAAVCWWFLVRAEALVSVCKCACTCELQNAAKRRSIVLSVLCIAMMVQLHHSV